MQDVLFGEIWFYGFFAAKGVYFGKGLLTAGMTEIGWGGERLASLAMTTSRIGVSFSAMILANLRRYATRGVILAALILGSLFTAAAAYALFWLLPPAASEEPQAALTWIPGPTNTPQPPTATLVPTSTATATFLPLESGELGIGSYAQITGTEGTGLNVRSAPGLSSNIQFLGFDAEVFEVRDGPVEQDGYTWWYLVTPVDETRAGWAAAMYLSVVANP